MTPKAEFNRGLAYYQGKGVPKNYQKAVYWLRKAAIQGYAPAELYMAIVYYDGGHGVPRND